MKKIVTIVIAAMAGHLLAGTYTWTGRANNGQWSTAGNWDYDDGNGGMTSPAATSPGGSPSDNVVINGDFSVTYDAGTSGMGDFSPQSGVVVNISNGASVTQDGGSWANFGTGAELVIDGGSYNGGTATSFRLNNGKLTIRNGGSFICANASLERNDSSVLTIESGTMVLGGNYAILSADTLGNGSISSSGELSLRTSVTLDGFNLSCKTLVPQNNPTITMKSGSISTRRTDGPDNSGIYGSCTINILVGKVCSFSALVWNDRTAYEDTYALSRFQYNGNALTEAKFAEIFTVETSTDGDRTRYTIATSEVAGAPAIETVGAIYADNSVSFAVTLAEESATDSVLTVFYDTTDHEHNTDFAWSNSAALVKDETDGAYKTIVSVAAPSRCYYLIRVVSSSAATTVWQAGSVVAADLPTDANVWLGKTGDMTAVANWSKGVLPDQDDVVELNEYFTEGTTLNWSVDAIPAVAGWRQSAAVCVYFDTTLEKPFTIGGDVSLGNGANWTCPGPENEGTIPVYALNISVGGDLTVASGAKIQTGCAKDTEFLRARGYRTCGPNWEVIAISQQNWDGNIVYTYDTPFGSAFAGDGGYSTEVFPEGRSFVSYGSILDPLSWGAAGHGDNFNLNYAGGGVVKIAVSGALTLDGMIESQGFGYPAVTTGGASTGGSINIVTGSLAGSGEINADGGCDRLHGNGSGGRVRVKLTGSSVFPQTVAVHAYGGTRLMGGTVEAVVDGVVDAAAGTVFLQTSADTEGAGVLRIVNSRAGDGATHLPSMLDGDASLASCRVEVGDNAKVRLTSTNKRRARVASLVVRGARVRSGVYTAAELNTAVGSSVFCGDGVLTVGGSGFVVTIR